MLPPDQSDSDEPMKRFIVSTIMKSGWILWLESTDYQPEAEEWFKEAADKWPEDRTTLFDSKKNIDLMFNGEYQL